MMSCASPPEERRQRGDARGEKATAASLLLLKPLLNRTRTSPKAREGARTSTSTSTSTNTSTNTNKGQVTS